MDIKSTVSKLCAILSVLLIPIFLSFGAVTISGHMPEQVLRYIVLNEEQTYTRYSYVDTYTPDWAAKAFYSLEEAILALEEDTYSDYYRNNASRMLYYAKNLKTGKIITNCDPITYQGEMTMDEFEIVCDQLSDSWVEYTSFDGKKLAMSDHICSDRFSEESWDEGAVGLAYKPIDAEYAGTYEIAFAFSRSYAYEGIVLTEEYRYSDSEMQRHWRYIVIGMVLVGCSALLFFLFLLCRKGRGMLSQLAAKGMRQIPLELKGTLLFLVLTIFLYRINYGQKIDIVILTSGLYWLLYLFWCDIRINRIVFLKHSICYGIYRLFRPGSVEERMDDAFFRTCERVKVQHRERLRMLPYQRQFRRRFLFYLACYLVGIFLCVAIGLFLVNRVNDMAVILFIIIGLGGITFWFYRRYMKMIQDVEQIASQIRLLRNGHFDHKLDLPEHSQLYFVAVDLNNLQDGLQSEIDKRMVSEKMKVELITNVSHDLKTPLTSMINYIDLLKEEELQPEHARAYVQVLDQKSQRLKQLIENIFDISKATSGNMPIHYERLSMADLVNQTLAECENRLELAELSIKKNYTDEKFYVYADGKMLWRITENILNNAVKYSLKGTRIYLELTEEDEFVNFTVKNIAGYEMDFTADSITERFVRGDRSRTTEGTGLGLSIVQSFIEAMGGKMEVTVDGDLFKISVCIRKHRTE